ncbi:MAG: hypothetical protein ABSH19_03225 [Opitutales bacterium]|jgi:hypothetical protein
MPWLPLTSADIFACLVAAQIETLRSRALAPGQPDPLPTLLADITARVRAEVRTFRRNRLDCDPTLLPPELKLAASHLALEALQARLPNLALTSDQILLAENARKLLERVANGEIAVSKPDHPEGPLAATVWYGLEVLRRRPLSATGRRLAGL